jgi:very-short-patch-repair endonuclease
MNSKDDQINAARDESQGKPPLLPQREERAGERRLSKSSQPKQTTQRPQTWQTANARRLRREQTDDEKELWRALRAGRFAGFKFRRQHPIGSYFLDFYCPTAKLSIELDGSQHGHQEPRAHDQQRHAFLEANGVLELRFWNHRWRANPHGILLDIWFALQKRTGLIATDRKPANHRFIPPDPKRFKDPTSSPQPSPPAALGREGD